MTIADTSGPFIDFFGVFGNPSLNDSGTVAFGASLDTGGQGIFTGSGGPTTTIADSSGPFKGFGNPSLNNSGTVASSAPWTLVGQASSPDPIRWRMK